MDGAEQNSSLQSVEAQKRRPAGAAETMIRLGPKDLHAFTERLRLDVGEPGTGSSSGDNLQDEVQGAQP